MKKYAIIVAGGSGLRMGTQVPKQFLLLQGQPVLWHTINIFLKSYEDLEVIVVLPAEHLELGSRVVSSTVAPGRVRMTEGGATRFHSVARGLAVIREDMEAVKTLEASDDDGRGRETCNDRGEPRKGEIMPKSGESEALMQGKDAVIGIHDGVRCLLTEALVHRCYEEAARFGSAIPVTDCKDSVRLVGSAGNEAIDRSRVKLVQTPQAFLASILLPSYRVEYRDAFTDDASVAEAAAHAMHLVEGETNNIKITTPVDLLIAERLMGQRPA